MFILLCAQSVILASSPAITVNINCVIQVTRVFFLRVIFADAINGIMLHLDFTLVERVLNWLAIGFLLNSIHTIIILNTRGPPQWVIVQNITSIRLNDPFLLWGPNKFRYFVDRLNLVVHGSLKVCTLRSPMIRIGSLELLATSWV